MFKPMLAAKANPAKLKFPLYVQPKLDGIRCCIVGGKALTRSLKEVPNREIFNALSRPEFNGLDGEIIVGEPTAPDCYRRTSSFVMSDDKTGGDWRYYVFDIWDDAELGFAERFEKLDAYGLEFNVVPVTLAPSAPVLEEIEARYIAEGHEGVILRSPWAKYKFGRGSATAGDLLKLKRFEDFEAEVIGVYEEQHNANEATKNALGRTERSSRQENKIGKDTLGGLILVGRTAYKGVEFRCGTGFDRAERAELWKRAWTVGSPGGALNGKIAKIKHFPVGAKDKPRFPTFLGWRDPSDL